MSKMKKSSSALSRRARDKKLTGRITENMGIGAQVLGTGAQVLGVATMIGAAVTGAGGFGAGAMAIVAGTSMVGRGKQARRIGEKTSQRSRLLDRAGGRAKGKTRAGKTGAIREALAKRANKAKPPAGKTAKAGKGTVKAHARRKATGGASRVKQHTRRPKR